VSACLSVSLFVRPSLCVSIYQLQLQVQSPLVYTSLRATCLLAACLAALSSFCLSSVRLSVRLSIHLHICVFVPVCLSIHVCLFMSLTACLSMHVNMCVSLSACLFGCQLQYQEKSPLFLYFPVIYISVCLYVDLPATCLFICLSACLPVCQLLYKVYQSTLHCTFM